MRRPLAFACFMSAGLPACALSHHGLGSPDGLIPQADTMLSADAAPDASDVPPSIDLLEIPIGSDATDAIDSSDAIDVADVPPDILLVDTLDVPVADTPMDMGPDTPPVDVPVDAPRDTPADAPRTYTLDPAGVVNATGAYGNGTNAAQHRTQHCGDTEVMTGATGYYGATLNALGIHCATLAPDGSLGGDRVIANQGYLVGTTFDQTCNTAGGLLAVGAFGRSGLVTDQLSLACSTVSAWLGGVTPTAAIGPWGGTGGSVFAAPCPAGTVMHGVDFDIYNWNGHDRVSNLTFQCIPVR